MDASFDPTKTPLAPNPNGDPPNFANGPSLAPTVLGVGILLIILSSACVITRLYTSEKIQRRLGAGDCCVLFGQLGAIAYWAIMYTLARDGFGKHTWDVPISFLNTSFTNRQFAAQILSSPVKLVTVSAIILLYLKVFGILKWVRICCYSLWVFVLLIQVMNVAIAIQWYVPRPGEELTYVINAMTRSGKTGSSAIVNSVCSVVVDIGLFLIPFFVVPTLNISKERRRALYVAFLFGILIIITGCVGVAYKTYGVKGKMGDPFWVGMIAIITVICEQFALVIVACVPSLSAFYLGTITKSRFYSSIQTSMARLKGTSRTKTSSSSTRTSSNDKSGSQYPHSTSRHPSETTQTSDSGVVILMSDREPKVPVSTVHREV